MQVLWRHGGARVRRPRNVAAVRKLPDGRPTESDGAVLSIAGACVRPMFPGAIAPVTSARWRSLPSTPTSRPTPAVGWSMHGCTTEIMRKRLDLTEKSFVVEVASNDGYLLQHFVEAGIPVLGISRRPTSPKPLARSGCRPAAASSALMRRGISLGGESRPICSLAITCSRKCRT